jgi:hydroxymethylbilane synthase
MRNLIAGSRGSKLALTQTEGIIKDLGLDIQLKTIKTRGDKMTDVALAQLEGKGFFTKELDDALLAGDIDFAVHSMKDLPTDLPDGIIVSCIPKRESPRDALVGKYTSLSELPDNAVVGTSSLRRKAALLHLRPDVSVNDLRGNLDTRVRKVNEGEFDSIIVAEAGLKRLGLTDNHPLDPKTFVPAAGQGALAVTSRKADTEVNTIFTKLDDERTRIGITSERIFLAELQGGCQVPAGTYTETDLNNDKFRMIGFVSSLDGKEYLTDQVMGTISAAGELARTLAASLLKSGGRDILIEIRRGGN